MSRFRRLQSMEGSLPPPLLQNRACHFCGTRLLSDVPFVRGIRLAVADSPEDLGSDVSRLPLAGHRSLAFTRGFSRFFALLLLITCPSPSSRQRLLGIPPGLGFWRNPSPYALRLAPAPIVSWRGPTGLLRSPFPWLTSLGTLEKFTFHRIMWWSPDALRDPLAIGQAFPHFGSSAPSTI